MIFAASQGVVKGFRRSIQTISKAEASSRVSTMCGKVRAVRLRTQGACTNAATPRTKKPPTDTTTAT